MIVKISNFTGPFEVSLNINTEDKLQEYIDINEPLFLNEILGCTLAQEFLADLDPQGEPQSVKFQELFNDLCFRSVCNKKMYQSAGLVDTLTGFICHAYKRNNGRSSSSGNVVTKAEVSKTAKATETNLDDLQNAAVLWTRAIQQYIIDNETIYGEFEGIVIDPVFSGLFF